MQQALFLQSSLADPYALYQAMRSKNPVYWDEANQLWAVYSYSDCLAVLNNLVAQVPLVDTTGLNECAIRVTNRLVRLSNSNQHEIARAVAMMLAGSMKPIPVSAVMEPLIDKGTTDWVEAVGKKLPVMAVLKSFSFSDADAHSIVGKTAQLLKIMLPHKTSELAEGINAVSAEIYVVVEKHLLTTGILNRGIAALAKKYAVENDNIISLCVSNLIGLVIQSYDAGSGILANALLQLLHVKNPGAGVLYTPAAIKKIVIETLRFDPPVQNTRRIATATMLIGNATIKKGATILVVLASANRDPARFSNAAVFDAERRNNNEHLTFGAGNHLCVANYFSVHLTTAALWWLFEQFKNINLVDTNIEYEPLVNVRLPKKIMICLG